MGVDILPESRMRRPVGSKLYRGHNYIPIYCHNCGVPKGMVPEEMVTFAFALCDPCAEVYGNDAHFYKEPDHVFWERVHNAQLEEFGAPLTLADLAIELDDPTSTISKLAKEWEAHVRKVGT